MFKNFRKLYLALLILFSWVLSQNVNAEAASHRNGFLFEVKKDGHVSYLLGTIHAGFSADQYLGENITSVLLRARKLYVEADISDSRNVDRTIETDGFTKDPLLKDMIGQENYDFYHKVLVDRARFLTENEYARAKPWLITIIMPVADPLQDDQIHLQFGSEMQLLPFSKQHGIPVGELEGIKAQMKVFDTGTSVAPNAIFDAYVNLVRNRVIYNVVRDEVMAWTNGDLTAFERVVAKRRALDDAYSHFYNESVLAGRNKSFAATISAISSKESGMFFAIGSEHLVGPDGVLSSLSKSGFQVRRL